jgi:hypothetical protein
VATRLPSSLADGCRLRATCSPTHGLSCFHAGMAVDLRPEEPGSCPSWAGRHGGGGMAPAGHNEGTSLREDAGYDEKC